VYSFLDKLQGSVIPKLLWYGTLVNGAVDALVTDFCGRSLADPTLLISGAFA